MIYKSDPNDPPTIIEHTTVNPVIERTTIVERDRWYAEPWAIAVIVGAMALVGLFCYWAMFAPINNSPAVVEHSTTKIVHDGTGRAERISSPAPNVIVNPPATHSTVNIETTQKAPETPVTTDETPSESPSSDNSQPENTDQKGDSSSSSNSTTPENTGTNNLNSDSSQ